MSSVLILEARFYDDIAAEMLRGAVVALDAAGATHEVVSVPGALELPGALEFAARGAEAGPRFDGYVALGCIIRGATTHFSHVSRECMHGLSSAVTRHAIALGTGVLTCETRDQAWDRARVDGGDKGGAAARAALEMVALRRRFVSPP